MIFQNDIVQDYKKMSQTFLRRTTTMELFKKQNILRKKPFDPYLREIQHKRA